ncbi:MAG TPA: MauE/DoxX family redox-associated membrane protein [Polyangia bacterium]
MKLKWIALALRVGLGALFVIAGALKLGDPMRFAIEVTNYRLLPALAPYLAVILPPVEVVLGLALIAMPRSWRRAAALALTGLMAIFTVAVAQVVARGINVDCGCFGGASGPVNGWTVARDVALFAMAAVVLVLESRRGASPRPTT